MGTRAQIDRPAPDFALRDFEGNPRQLSDFRGQHVLLVFNRGFF